jgi:hypothetical protein
MVIGSGTGSGGVGDGVISGVGVGVGVIPGVGVVVGVGVIPGVGVGVGVIPGVGVGVISGVGVGVIPGVGVGVTSGVGVGVGVIPGVGVGVISGVGVGVIPGVGVTVGVGVGVFLLRSQMIAGIGTSPRSGHFGKPRWITSTSSQSQTSSVTMSERVSMITRSSCGAVVFIFVLCSSSSLTRKMLSVDIRSRDTFPDWLAVG